MSDNINDINYGKNPGNGKVLAGIIMLAVGGILLLRQFDFPYIPDWIFSFPMLLIAIGLYGGSKRNWKNPAWIISIIIGFALLLDRIIPGFEAHDLAWPVIIIGIGLWMILRRNHNWDRRPWKKDWEGQWDRHYAATNNPAEPAGGTTENTSSTIPPYNPGASSSRPMGDDTIDTVSVFGSVKKIVLSKDFKGGDIVNIFGGAEIDLTQADINGRVVIDITQLFGGTKIIVPPHWQVVSDLAAVFAGVDDKRLRQAGTGDNNKILVLKGVSIFAGVDIRSY